MATDITYVRAGDTVPLTIIVGGPADLTDVATAELFARLKGADTNHVDGAACTIPDENVLEVEFDPAGNGPAGGDAFGVGSEGTYVCYVRLTYDNGDTSRHPRADDGSLDITVTEAYEAE